MRSSLSFSSHSSSASSLSVSTRGGGGGRRRMGKSGWKKKGDEVVRRPFPSRGGFVNFCRSPSCRRETVTAEGQEDAAMHNTKDAAAAVGDNGENGKHKTKKRMKKNALFNGGHYGACIQIKESVHMPMPRYIALGDTLPDEGRFVTTDKTNILIRSLTYSNKRTTALATTSHACMKIRRRSSISSVLSGAASPGNISIVSSSSSTTKKKRKLMSSGKKSTAGSSSPFVTSSEKRLRTR